ncbi:hypothetical protein [uncultured Variovorax sp.]|uniref:hypothetical protein n=1 Tax=uncultured Variovorax sp. TaxID=114708 RepID=UPI00260DAF1E|nr:hypothetical protein [uncultured Variovorax sp.]
MAEMRLTFVRALDSRSGDGHRMGLYQCSCGNEATVMISRVKSGVTKSCGCLRHVAPPGSVKHGMRGSREYSSWTAMRQRCLNSASKDFRKYGAKGITVHPEWIESFQSFFDHIGPRPPGTTLDRIDGRRGYEPGNVRWATAEVQARNRPGLTMVRTPAGVMPLGDFAKSIGITIGAAHMRLRRGKLEGATHA